jgi:hypothetical protein
MNLRSQKLYVVLIAGALSLSLLLLSPSASSEDNETLGLEIRKLTSDLSCDTNDQCKSIGFGDKPCGGFSSYLPYSTKTVDEISLIEKVSAYNTLDREYHQKNQIVSTCEMLLQPTVTCVQGQCTLANVGANIY